MNQQPYSLPYKQAKGSLTTQLSIYKLKFRLHTQQRIIRYLTALANRTRIELPRAIELQLTSEENKRTAET